MKENPINGRFGIIRGKKPLDLNFSLRSTKKIPVGVEGRKFIAEVESRRGKHGTYFFKDVHHESSAQYQKEKYSFLKSRGIKVPKTFKPSKFEDGIAHVVVSDLEENGKYEVISTNNPQVDTLKFKEFVLRISSEVAKKIMADMLFAAEAAAGLFDNVDQSKSTIYEFQVNAFILKINPDNPDDTDIFVADFGIDIMEEFRKNQKTVAEKNILAAAKFYSYMMGRIFEIPQESQFYYLQAKVAEVSHGNLKYRGYE